MAISKFKIVPHKSIHRNLKFSMNRTEVESFYSPVSITRNTLIDNPLDITYTVSYGMFRAEYDEDGNILKFIILNNLASTMKVLIRDVNVMELRPSSIYEHVKQFDENLSRYTGNTHSSMKSEKLGLKFSISKTAPAYLTSITIYK